jgi:DNA replication protein DnaC
MINVMDDKQILKTLIDGKNVFLTGSAGCGKSTLSAVYANNFPNIILTATTGVAAIYIGGETIHRFAGIGISARDFEADKIINKWNAIKKSSKPWDKVRWDVLNNTKTIIIDEVSMLRRDQFELIDIEIGRAHV